MVIAFLKSSGLSQNLWPQATYIKNRLPHSSINHQIPHELFFNKPVQYENEHVWGEQVIFVGSHKEVKLNFIKIQTDNGTEFNNRKFNEFCDSNHIQHLNTVINFSFQNGPAERGIRNAKHTAGKLLDSTCLIDKFWSDAIAFSAYVRVCTNSQQKFVQGSVIYSVQ